uniref:L1 transposable element RRM domain-containing protein n=1 Tax=Oryzias latipes TaxID=8090 RepID=A0A3P9K356_ORYLA
MDSDMGQPVTNKTLVETLQQFKNEMLSHFDAKLDTFHNSVHQMQDSLNSIKTTVGELVGSNQDELSRLETRIKQLEKQNSYLAEKVEDVENQSRASNIRLLRVPEGSEGRDMIGFVGHLLIQLFGQDKLPSPLVIERAHRSPGTPNPNPKAGPQPILVRFLHFQDKLNILRLSRDKKELLFKGNRVHIYPDFSAGGVATYVSSNMQSHIILPKVAQLCFEDLFIKLILHDHKHLIIGNIYRPPNSPSDSVKNIVSTADSVGRL